MTPEQKLIAIAAIINDQTTPDNPPKAWFDNPTDAPPTTPLPNADNESEVLRYAAHGFRIDMSRGVAPSDFPHMLTICRDIERATTPEEADAAIQNAGYFPPKVAQYLVLTGCTQGMSSFLTPSIFAPAAIQTVRDAALYATRQWTGGAGPGIG
jgi:hypothetical protein